jgi:site-specific DNA-cytosine methylase
MSGLTITDLFCGAGGSGLGAAAAGYQLVIAANHWQLAIDTHATNFPDAEHDCADISQVNPRRYPATDVLWASPECTNHSQAKGRRRQVIDGPDLFALVVPVEGREGKRAQPASAPLRTMTARAETALVVPYYSASESASSAAEPIGTLTTHDRYGIAFVAELRGGGSHARNVTEPLATVVASGNHHMLVRQNTARGNPGQMCTSAAEPMRTLTTAGHQSLVSIEQAVADCSFRMLEPAEIQLAMAFGAEYRVLGNRREKVRQLGNGVTPPAAEFLLRAIAESLDGSAA